MDEIKRMQQLAGIISEVNSKGDPLISGPNDRHNIWAGEPQPIPDELSDKLTQYSDKEATIFTRLQRKKNLDGYSMFRMIKFNPKRFYYNKRNQAGYYGQYAVGFEKGDKIYPGELKMLEVLLQNIENAGIQPNQK